MSRTRRRTCHASRLLVAVVVGLVAAITAEAAIYPIDRARFLAGSRFDFKVEFDRKVAADAVTVTVNGVNAELLLVRKPQVIENEDGSGK